MKLIADIQQKRKHKEILLMTHIVTGYPSFSESMKIVEAMVKGGVDLMELQIPFSEPTADGPVILHANQQALNAGSTVERCLEFTQLVATRFDIPFVVMTYYNILFTYGVKAFVNRLADAGLYGAIVPDLPPEEATDYVHAMKLLNLAPIFIYTPTTSNKRMRTISEMADGMIYCVARRGVTGATTEFSGDLDRYLERCKGATNLPLALGFGVKDRQDIDYLKGRVDIAVVGTQTIRLIDEQGIAAVQPFVEQLNS